MEDQYWAGNSDVEEVIKEASLRVSEYFGWLKETGRSEKAQRCWNTYYGYSPDGTGTTAGLTPGGDGELVRMNTNHFAGLLSQSVVMVTANKPSFKAVAVNTDSQSLSQASLAEGVLQHYDRNLFLHAKDNEVAFRAMLTSEALEALYWNPAIGETYSDGDQVAQEGDVEACVHSLFDYAFDCTIDSFDDAQWICLRRPVNRWDLAATYPEKREEILAAGKGKDQRDAGFEDLRFNVSKRERSDFVDVWELRHPPTPALPSGRLVRYLSPQCWLFDTHTDKDGNPRPGAYPYGNRLMARRMTPAKIVGSPGGHTLFFDLLAQQEGLDLVATIMASTVNTGGASNFYMRRGANIKVNELGGGFNIIEGDVEDAPRAMDMAKVSPEALKFAAMCEDWMRQRTSINRVVSGEPQKGMPAQAMALLRAEAIESYSDFQDEHSRFIEGIRSDLIAMLKSFIRSERAALIAGSAGKWKIQKFEAKDLAGIDRVVIEAISAQSQTFAGRMAMAQDLLQRGLIGKEQYLSMISSGKFETVLEAQESNMMRIQEEKELLRQGIGLPPIDPEKSLLMQEAVFVDDGQPHVIPNIADTHWIDIPEYLSVIHAPLARQNPAVVKAVTEVVEYKLDLWRKMDPALLMLQGGPPCPPKMDPAVLGMPGGSLGGPPANDNGRGAANDNRELSVSPMPNIEEKMAASGKRLPNMPRPPADPLTGEQRPPALQE